MADMGIPRVELCKTTEADVRRAFGEPSRVGLLHGWRLLTWRRPPRVSSSDDAIPFIGWFDDRGVLVDACYDPPGAVNFVPVDQCSGRFVPR